jgi:hypothetical protein
MPPARGNVKPLPVLSHDAPVAAPAVGRADGKVGVFFLSVTKAADWAIYGRGMKLARRNGRFGAGDVGASAKIG